MAAVASSLVSLVSPLFLHPFMVCFPHKVRGIFKNKFRSCYCPLKILQLYHTTINRGFELWSSSPSAGTHSHPLGRDAVPIPSCCECHLPLALENHPLPKDLMCPNSDMPPFLGAAHSQRLTDVEVRCRINSLVQFTPQSSLRDQTERGLQQEPGLPSFSTSYPVSLTL